MRKFFSILCASLVALAMQATMVTKEYDLSDLTKQQESTTWSANELTVTNGWHGIAHDYGEYPYNAEDYTELTLELASTSEVGVNLAIRYSDNSTSDKTINAGSLIARIPLSSSSIKRIDIKLTAAGSATISRLYFSKVIGKETVTNLFTGSNTFDWNWNHRILIPNTAFASIHEGDRIQFTYTSGASGQCQVRVQNLGDENNQLTETGAYAAITQNQVESANFSFVLRAEDIEKVKQNGLYFHGNAYTITSIDLHTYAELFMEEIELAHGSETLNWGETWKQTSLPTLAAGDELHATVCAVNGSNNYQLNFKYGWNAGQQITVEGVDATVPKLYTITLTAEQAAAINSAGQLFLYGTGVTLSRFAIAQPRSIYTALYHGEKAIDWTGLFFEASNFSGLTVGDRLCANVSAIGDMGSYPQLYFDANYESFSPEAHYNFSANNAAPMAVSYPVTSEMISLLQTNGLRVKGQHCTITEVYVQDAEPTTVSYKLPISNARMATLVLPFDVPSLPSGVQAYDLTNDGSEDIVATEVYAVTADKPVLIVADENAEGYEFDSEEGASDDISGKAGTYRNGALVGTYRRIDPLYGDDGEGGNYHYILQKHDEEVAFYQVLDETCYVLPYRAYLSCAYNANVPQAGMLPRKSMRIVFHTKETTGLGEVQGDNVQSTKVFENGVLYIKHNGIKYNIQGQLCK